MTVVGENGGARERGSVWETQMGSEGQAGRIMMRERERNG